MGVPNLRELFERRVRNHDVTYGYSDDPSSYRAGADNMYAIRALAKEINDPEYTKKVWNDNIDQRLIEGFRESFYWK